MKTAKGFLACVFVAGCTAVSALAQCPQDWIENGGLPATDAAGEFTHAAVLNASGHKYIFACGSFGLVDNHPVSDFVVFDNHLIRSPFELPGWEHVTGVVRNMKTLDGKVYFAGSFNVNGGAASPLIAWDGSTLETFPAFTQVASHLAVGMHEGQREICLGSTGVFRLSGAAWTTLGSAGSSLRGIEFLDDGVNGHIIALTGTNGVEVRQFNGATWERIGLATTSAGFGFAGSNTLYAEGHGNEATLYVGGSFEKMNGIVVKNIASYRDGIWSDVGAGIAGQVFSIVRTGAAGHSELVAGTHSQQLTTAAYATIPDIRVLRGGGWQPILTAPSSRSPMIGGANALVGDAMHLLMIGDYSNEFAPGVRSPLAQWDGSAWTAISSSIGSGGVVGAIETLDLGSGPQVFAAGNFKVQGSSIQSIARFDGNGWSSGGLGLPHTDANDTGYGVTALGMGHTANGLRPLAGLYDPSQGRGFIMMFDGTQWVNFSQGISGWNANQFLDYDAGDGLHTYAIVKLASPPLCRLDGNTWHGITSSVTYSHEPFAAVTFDNGDGEAIYIGCHGGSPQTHPVQRWSGARGLENFDTGLPPTANGGSSKAGVTCLFKMPAGGTVQLLAGGDFFPLVPTQPNTRFLARLNGHTWEQFTPIPPGPVAELAMHDFGSGPVLTALVYTGTSVVSYLGATGLRPYRLVNGAWESFGNLTISTTSLYQHNTGVGVMREFDGTLFVAGPIRSVNGKISNLIARFAPGQCFCAADINQDGAGDFFDYLDFVNAFAARDAAADFNRDGAIDMFDYLDFVDALAGGC